MKRNNKEMSSAERGALALTNAGQVLLIYAFFIGLIIGVVVAMPHGKIDVFGRTFLSLYVLFIVLLVLAGGLLLKRRREGIILWWITSPFILLGFPVGTAAGIYVIKCILNPDAKKAVKNSSGSNDPTEKPQSAHPAARHGGHSKHTGEAPLDEYYDASNARYIQRTSRHSPGRRRENNNRASRWAVSMLLLRAVLIVLLLGVGFVVLKLVLNRMAEPSERQKQQWEAKASRMGAPPAEISAASPAAVSPEWIKQRLELWEQTRRHLRSADALNRQGMDEEALQRLGQALRVAPDNQTAQQMLVDIYLRKGRFADAVPVCIRLLDQDSGKPELQMKLLQALQASGQTEAGLVLAQRMLEDQPNDLNILSIAAAGQVELGDMDAALGLFSRILDNDAKNKEALKSCGEIYLKRGAYQQAVPYYLDLVRLDSRPEHYHMLARCYAQQNEAGKAIIFMGQASSLFGSSTVAPWLKESVFDPVRETVEFRSFADRIVGIETRTAIEAINKRVAEKPTTPASLGEGLTLPNKGDLNAISPRKQ